MKQLALLTLFLIFTGSAWAACDLNATPSNFAAQLAAATPGQTICLASGSYGDFSGVTKTSPGVTITGLGANPLPTMRIEFTSNTPEPAWLILDNIHFTSSNGGSGFPGDLNYGHNITFQNSHFGHFLNVGFATGEGGSILFNNDLFDVSDGTNLNGDEGRIQVKGTDPLATTMTIKNSRFTGGCADGMQFGGGGSGITVGPNNEFYNLKQGTCGPHVDSIQFNSVPSPGPTITGNYFHDNSTGIVGYDFANFATITNNVLQNIDQSALGGNAGGTIVHNTLYNDDLSCGVTHEGNVCQSVFKDNIATDFNNSGGGTGNPAEVDYNLFTVTACSGAFCGIHNLTGTPTYVGGANPTTYAGFALANGSVGKNAADDGNDMGINVTSTGPQLSAGPSLTFSGQNVGTTSPSQTITISNPGTSSATLSSISPLTGPNAGDFAESSNTCGTLPVTLTAGGSCTVNITLTPSGIGPRTATFTAIDTPDSLNASTILSGTGVDPNAANVIQSVSCGPQTFPGTCAINATSAGNLIAVAFSSYNSSGAACPGGVTGCAMTSVTDNASGGSNTYQEATGSKSIDSATDSLSGAQTSWNDIWYSHTTHSGATTITVTPNTSGTGDVFIWEIANAPSVNVSGQSSSQGPSSTPSSPSLMTSLGTVIVANLHPSSSCGGTTGLVAGSPFTSDSLNDNMAWAHLITSSAGTYNTQWNTANCVYASNAVAFSTSITGGPWSTHTWANPSSLSWGVVTWGSGHAWANPSGLSWN